MKKTISLLLTVVLLLMAIGTVPAFADDSTTDYRAPLFYGVQTAEGSAENRQDIRFVSVVENTRGTRLGYIITAEYTDGGAFRSVEYSAACGDNVETNVIYSLITAGDYAEEITAEELGAELGVDAPAGLFALCIRDVPTDIGEIIFTVKAYVKDGADIQAVSDETSFVMDNGKISDRQVVYRENFNDKTLSVSAPGAPFENAAPDKESYLSALQHSLGWTGSWVNTGSFGNNYYVQAQIADGKLTINENWQFFSLFDPDTLEAFESYTVGMDLRFDYLGLFNLYFNSTNDLDAGKDYISFRNFENGTQSGTNDSHELDNNNVIRIKDGYQNSYATDQLAYGEFFRLSFTVSRIDETVSVFVNGKQIFQSGLTLVGNGNLTMCIQNAPTTIDNIVVTGTLPRQYEVGEVLLERDFEDGALLRPGFGYDDTPKQSIVEDGNGKHLEITPAWGATELVPAGMLAMVDQYTLELDVTTDNGGFLNLIYNFPATAYGMGIEKEFINNGAYASAILRGEDLTAGKPVRLHMANYDGSSTNASYLQKNIVLNGITETNGVVSFRLKMEVDNSGDSATVNIYANDVLIYTATGVNSCNGGIFIWTQHCKNNVQIDNVKLTAGIADTAE